MWIVQSVAVASVVAALVERVTRRLIPLQVLLGMSLTFPDHAPSRFKIALRSGTLKKLRSRVPDISDGGTATVQQAAEHAVQLVTTLGKHERLTRGHTERVRAYTDLIAVELRLSDEDRTKLAWAAMLHDIGKLAVPAEILNKSSRPTESEWAILATHPAAGQELLGPLQEWLGDWLLAASQHHERWDGNGYPAGLAGDDISLAGRIVAVADAYDVITSHRSYKQPMSLDAARSELVACAGNQFDPDVVRAMLNASKSDATSLGKFAGLLEMRTVSHALNSLSGTPIAIAATVAALPAFLGVPGLAADQTATPGPPEVAFAQTADPGDAQTPATSALPGNITTTIEGLPTVSGVNDQTTTSSLVVATYGPADTSVEGSTPLTTSPITGPGASPTTASTGPATTSTPGAPSTSSTSTTTTTAPTTASTLPPADDCERAQAGQTNLVNADLTGCDLSGLALTGADLRGADMSGANFSNATLDSFNMNGATVNDAVLNGATLTNGSAASITALRLEFSSATLINVDLSDSTLFDLNMSGSNLTNTSFVNSSVSRSNFTNSTLVGVSFADTSLNNADFTNADAPGTDFTNSGSQRVTFDGADLRDSNFFNAILVRSTFIDANASGSILRDAGITQVNLTRTNLQNASGTPGQSQNATYNATICPDGVVRNTTCWP